MVPSLKKHFLKMPSSLFSTGRKSEGRERLILSKDPDFRERESFRSERGIDGELLSRGTLRHQQQFVQQSAAAPVILPPQTCTGLTRTETHISNSNHHSANNTSLIPANRDVLYQNTSSVSTGISEGNILSWQNNSHHQILNNSRRPCDNNCSCEDCEFLSAKKSRTLKLVSGGNGYDMSNGYPFGGDNSEDGTTGSRTFSNIRSSGSSGDVPPNITIILGVPRLDPETSMYVIEVRVEQPEENRLKVYQQNLSQLKQCGWYYDNINYQQAQTLLQNTEPGTFLLRASSDKRFMFSLSVQTIRGPTSVRVNWVNNKFQLDAEKKYDRVLPKYETVIGLLENHVQSSRNGGQVWVEPNGELYSRVILTKPLKKQVPKLQHLCRVTLNRNMPKDSLPPGIQSYLDKYPYQM